MKRNQFLIFLMLAINFFIFESRFFHIRRRIPPHHHNNVNHFNSKTSQDSKPRRIMFPQRMILRRNGINHVPFMRNFGLGGVFFRKHLMDIMKKRREENEVKLI